MQSAGITVAGALVFVIIAGVSYRRYKRRTELSRLRALSELEQSVSIRERTESLYGASHFVNNPIHDQLHADESAAFMAMPQSNYHLVRSDGSNALAMTATGDIVHPYDIQPIDDVEANNVELDFYCDAVHTDGAQAERQRHASIYQNPLAQRARELQDVELPPSPPRTAGFRLAKLLVGRTLSQS